MEFKGFPEGKIHQIPVPDPFFRDLLPQIDHLGELKLTLYIFWRLERMEGPFRFLREADFLADKAFMAGLAGKAGSTEVLLFDLQDALQRAVRRGTLLQASLPIKPDTEKKAEQLYFLNSPKGRAAVRAIERGEWRPGLEPQEPAPEVREPPNIFRLYEENIGALTPMIADSLTEAEQSYPLDWIEDAIRLSVQNNKRSWRYALAILERWRQEGKHGSKEDAKDRSDAEETRRRYVKGEFSEFVEH
jgi:DNA replication protein